MSVRALRAPGLLALFVLAAPLHAQSVLHTFLGDGQFDEFGAAVSGVGDIDKDGFPDVGVGAWKDDNNGNGSGMIRVFSGRTGATVHSFNGDNAGDQLGWWVDAAGDVDGDGFGDVVGGAIFDDDTALNCGMLRVWSGQTGAILYSFYGDAQNDNLGGCATGAGDVDMDGFPDLIGGMDRHDLTGADAGSVRVYSGKTGAVLFTIGGDSPNDNFGFACDGAGDLNGDGFGDFVVGTPLDDNNGADSGMVRAFSGQGGGVLYSVNGGSAGAELGWSVEGAGDVDGDGAPDVVAGAAAENTANGATSGAVYVLSGATGAAIHVIPGAAAGAQWGYSVGGIGDLDRDGHDDFAAGGWLADVGASNSGSVRVFSGATGGVLQEVHGLGANDRLGRSCAIVGDVDGDGYAEFAAGAFLNDVNGSNAGAAYLHSGCDGGVQSYGAGCAGAGGFVPVLDLLGCPGAGQTVTLSIEHGAGGAQALVFLGVGQAQVPMGAGCDFLLAAFVPGGIPLVLSPGGAGDGAFSLSTVMPAIGPVTFTMQALVADPVSPTGHTNSNGVEVTVP